MNHANLKAGQYTVCSLLTLQAARIPDKVYVRDRERAWTYAQVEAETTRFAHGFRAMGVAKGDVVCLLMGNCLEFLPVWFGLNKVGAIEFPVNPALTGELLSGILNYATCRVLVVDDSLLEHVAQVARELTRLEILVVRRTQTTLAQLPDRIGAARVVAIDALRSPELTPIESNGLHSDVMAIMSTSGTTGQPKGVMLTHHHELVLAEEYLRNMRYGSDDVLYNCLPMFHNIGQAFWALPALLAGATMVMVDRFSASGFWDDLVQYGCTGFNFMGAMVSILCKQPPVDNERRHAVRGAFGLPRPPGTTEDFEKRFGITLIEGFGQTEANIVTYLPWEDRRSGSCGKAIARFEVLVVDDDDQPVAVGSVGEMVVRPREAHTITAGYFNLPEETVKASRNLWWHTGDFGRQDEDGFFYFVDRKKDVIRRRGENISSLMVERIADRYQGVLESAAVGVPSELSENDVMLVVVPRVGQTCSPEELLAHCALQLPRFALPSYLLVVDALPKTPNGKVRKHLLRAPAMVARATKLPEQARK
jgi:crotonobetaine/carnitine-CoA ligase